MANSLVIAWRRSQAIEKEYQKALKERTTFGVYMHTSQNGYVVREILDGKMSGGPYKEITPVKIFKHEKVAKEYADKLNIGQGYL